MRKVFFGLAIAAGAMAGTVAVAAPAQASPTATGDDHVAAASCKEGFQHVPPMWTNCSNHGEKVLWAAYNNGDPAKVRNGTSCMAPGKHYLLTGLVGWPYTATKAGRC